MWFMRTSGIKYVECLAWNIVSAQQMLHFSFPSHPSLHNDRIYICIYLPAMWETWVRSLGQEDPLEKGYPLQYSCLENPMDRGAWQATVCGTKRVGHD